MLAVYQRMQAEGKIGPLDANGNARPFQEYPKWVTGKDGAKVIVNSKREELAVASEAPGAALADPVIAERNALAEENERLRAQLAALATAGSVPAEASPIDYSKPPVVGPVQTKTRPEASGPAAATGGLNIAGLSAG
jgi:hypothetical protein